MLDSLKNKKGISPLVATVILVGFVVVVIALVILWGYGFVTEQAEKSDALNEAHNKCLGTLIEITGSSNGFILFNSGGEDFSGTIIRQECDESTVDTRVGHFKVNSGESIEFSKTNKICGEAVQFPAVLYSNADSYTFIPSQIPSQKRGAPIVPCSDSAVRVRNS